MTQEKQSSAQDELITGVTIVIASAVLVISLLPSVSFLLIFIALWTILRLKWWRLALPALAVILVLVFTNMAGQLLSNYLRQNSALNAEKLASVIGTDESYELTYQVQEREFFSLAGPAWEACGKPGNLLYTRMRLNG
jgi:hypothetical protein